jgi:1,4-dihydroxy-2-naphthoate polyprenyltransferase
MNLLNISIHKILRIIRFHIVLGGVLAFSIGVLLAISQGGAFQIGLVLFGYGTIFFGDLSSHFSNDYFDVKVDSYTEKKRFFGGSKILVDEPNLRLLARNISLVLLVLSIAFAGLAVFFFRAPIILLVIMLFANSLGWFYSAPPLRLVSRGFGEVIVAWVTGFVIPGVGYLSVRNQLDSLFLYLSIPFMLYGFILSLSLHVTDREIDQRIGRETLAVRSGAKKTAFLILISCIMASLAFLIYYLLSSSCLIIGIIFTLSTLTLMIVSFSYARFWKSGKISVFATSNIVSLFLFNILMVIYLILYDFLFV